MGGQGMEGAKDLEIKKARGVLATKKPRRMDSPPSFLFGPGWFEPVTSATKVRALTAQPLGVLPLR